MNLTNEKLIAILSEKLGKDEEWVANELTRLVNEIKSAAGKGETFSIEKFGTFKDKNGRLTFDADETFALEINYKYAGMSAIELQSPENEEEDQSDTVKSTTETAESAEVAETTEKDETSETVDNDADEEPEIKSETEPAEKESGVEEENEEQEPTPKFTEHEEPFEEPQDRKLEDILGITITKEDSDEEQEDKKEDKVDVSKEIIKKEEKVKPPQKEKPHTPVKNVKSGYKRQTASTKKTSKKKNGSFVTVLILAMIVVVVGLVVFIIKRNKPFHEQTVQSPSAQVHNKTPQNPKAENTNKTASTAMKTQASTGNMEPASNNMKVNNTRQQSDVKEKNKIINELASTTTYGLKGKIKPEVKSFYTIVVYSLLNENRADTQQKNLDDQGFRVVVTQADVDSTHLWRVGLGQFKNVQDAEKAATRLPGPFLSNHFIKRIQIR